MSKLEAGAKQRKVSPEKSDSDGEHISPDRGSFVNWVALSPLTLVKKQTRMIPENRMTLPKGDLKMLKRERITKGGETLRKTHI